MQEWLAKLRTAAKWQGTSAADKALADVRHELEQLHPDELELLVRHAKGSGTKFLASYIRTWDARLDDARRRYGTRPKAVRVDAATVAAPAAGTGAAPAAAPSRAERDAWQSLLPATTDSRGEPLPGMCRARVESVETALSSLYSAADAAAMQAAFTEFRAEWERIDAMEPSELAALNAELDSRHAAEMADVDAMLASLSGSAASRAADVLTPAWNAIATTTVAA